MLFFVAQFSQAQIVTIPDANFKNFLVTSNCVDVDYNGVGDTDADLNNDGEIQVSEATAVLHLNIYGTAISNLQGLESFSGLLSLNVSQTSISTFQITNYGNLRDLTCSSNGQLVSETIANCNSLTSISSNFNNALTTMNVSNCPLIYFLQVTENSMMSTLQIVNCTNLRIFDCSRNSLSSLDFSHCPNLESVDLTNSRFLVSLNIKNGRNENSISLGGAQNLRFICADESQVLSVQNQVPLSYVNCYVSSYCSFTPGGNYNTITGIARFDANGNGCDMADVGFNNLRIGINDGTSTGATFTNASGNYSFNVQQPNLTLTPSVENPTYFVVSPLSATVNFPTNNFLTQTRDFCITANGIHNDVEVVVVPISPARPGFDAVYNIVYRNKGNQTISGNISFSYNDTVLDFVSASLTPDSQSVGGLNWNYSNLLPFESRSFTVVLNVNSPVETPAVNIGDQLNFAATINPIAGDDMPIDNVFGLKQIVVGSFDPNNKICLEGDVVSPSKIGDYLHYTVNFENTGTAPAQNIVVKDVIDISKFDISTLQVMNASHAVSSKVTGNVVEFIFENINLAASQHGNVVFKIKTKSTLVTGDAATNKANIFFDYNAPIVTNLASTIFQTLGVNENVIDSSVTVYPNPAKDLVTVKSANAIKSIQFFDVQGRLMFTRISNDLTETIDMTSNASGIYFVKITTTEGVKIEKILKS